jgi:hypothetical protein
MEEKFILCKGKEGWGDRLQCLLMAIAYANKTKRHLVLDWRDDEWCHDKTEDVSEYFTIEGNCKYKRDEFFEYYNANKDKIRTSPRDSHEIVTELNYKPIMRKSKYCFGRGPQILFQIATKGVIDFEEELTVYNTSGLRSWKYGDFSKIKLSEKIEKNNLICFLENDLVPRQYNVLHMRGGTKEWNGGYVGQKRYRTKINTAFPTKDSYFKFLKSEYDKVDTKLPLLILTDYRKMAEEWIDHYKCGFYLKNTQNDFFIKCGTHKIPDEKLKETGYDKKIMNAEILRDQSLMLNAKSVINDGISYFSNMAKRLHKKNINFAKNDSFIETIKQTIRC